MCELIPGRKFIERTLTALGPFLFMINVGLSPSRVYPQPFRWGTARCTSIKTLPRGAAEAGEGDQPVGEMGEIDCWVQRSGKQKRLRQVLPYI